MGKTSEGKQPSRPAASPKPAPSPPATSPKARPGAGNSANRQEKRIPGTIKKQCVPYTMPSGCVNGKNCPFQHANDPVTQKPLPPLQEDIDRYQAALKRNPHWQIQTCIHSWNRKPSTAVPTLKMIRVNIPDESEEEPDPEQPTSGTEILPPVPRPPWNHPNPEGPIDLGELSQQFEDQDTPIRCAGI